LLYRIEKRKFLRHRLYFEPFSFNNFIKLIKVMADKPAEPGGEEEKDGKEKEKTCGEKYEACIIFTFKVYEIIL
jgi:hypothetical protein